MSSGQNIIIATDAYKLTHHLQYPTGLNKLYSYGEARAGGQFDTTSWFGLQMILKEHFLTPVTTEMIDDAETLSRLTFGTDAFFNRDVWEKVRDLGYLPVIIKALPEGLEVPTGTVLFTLESTQPWFATSLNALESVLMHVWYPTTIATNSLYIKKALRPFYEKTGTVANLDFAVNDFGLRGATSLESARRGGAGHLLHFVGSDNLPASQLIADAYHYAGRGQSVWATEHSVATSYGDAAGELDYLKAQIQRAPDQAILSIVIDSYDALHFITDVVGNEEIINLIKSRTGRVVFRPDSGNPKTIDLAVLNALADLFGTTVNALGYRVLNDNVGVIQGDGMNRQSIIDLYEHIISEGWSADNLVVGSGGGLLQEGFTRDTQRFAIKAAYVEFDNGKTINIQKKPAQDLSKASKTGLLKVVADPNGVLKTVSQSEPGQDLLQVVYHNGQLFEENFETILSRID